VVAGLLVLPTSVEVSPLQNAALVLATGIAGLLSYALLYRASAPESWEDVAGMVKLVSRRAHPGPRAKV
jgi:uncharacterized membrane protein